MLKVARAWPGTMLVAGLPISIVVTCRLEGWKCSVPASSGLVVSELAYGNYERQIMLPGDVQAENIKASFDNGVLTVDVPRSPRPKPVRIDVQQRQLEGAGSKKS